MTLRRLVSSGNVRLIRSENGTDFVGADKQLHEEFMKIDHSKIADFHSKPILSGMLKAHEILYEESFQTILVEIENVINSRVLRV